MDNKIKSTTPKPFIFVLMPFDRKFGGEIETLRRQLTERLTWAIEESKRQRRKNISEKIFVSLFGKEIPDAQLGAEIPLFEISDCQDLPIFIRNDSPESTPPINYIYLITSYGSKIYPLRETIREIRKKEQFVDDYTLLDYKHFILDPAIFDSPDGRKNQYPLPVTISSLPSKAIYHFDMPLIGHARKELMSIRIHTLSNYYDFPFKVTTS